jgi:predicted SAM-dependent methyltransferase
MNKKFLNLGCGVHFSNAAEWTNIDFKSNKSDVLEYNLLRGIPSEDNSYDMVYHSHVLEHFSELDGFNFIRECHRVLKPGGTIRIAIPDLEQIAANYLKYLDLAWNNLDNEIYKYNYKWMLIEMYDQAVRNISGGRMLDYLSQQHIVNEKFVFERIGDEGKVIRNRLLESKQNISHPGNKIKVIILNLLRLVIRSLKSFKSEEFKIGKFRQGGEIHKWMYDRYSLRLLLTELGFVDFKVTNAFESYEESWPLYQLDGKDFQPRKPDSLYIEAIKPSN